MPLTDQEAHSLAAFAREIDGAEWPCEPVDPTTMVSLLRWLANMPNPGALWRHLRNPGPLAWTDPTWSEQPVNIETIAAVVYEQATTCPKSSNRRHTADSAQLVASVIDRSRALHSDAGACQYCHFSGEAMRAVQDWEASQQPQTESPPFAPRCLCL
jgi:hypothetical protein